jgi:LysM repeat protein
LKSEENTVDRKRIATTNTDEIYGKVFHRPPSGGTGVQMHYQYNGGTVQYLKPRTEEMDSSFTPAIKDLKKKYKYYIVNGWPQEYHIAQPGQTLSDVAVMNGTTEAAIRAAMLSKKLRVQENTDGTLVSGKMVYLPNNSLNPVVETSYLNETDYTTKSSHNARVDKLTDLTSEKIKIEVPTSPEHNYTEWVSEEKIYDGVVNYNDIPMNYSRRQLATLQTSSLEREYTVLNGDTWSTIAKKHIVNLDDLMLKNKGITLTAGQKVVVPANILLPYIEHGVEFDTLNPFEVTIVDNSVQKKDGTPLDKALIPVDWSASTLPLQVWYKASSPVTVEIKRGNIPNDRDALKHRRVLQITNVKKKNGMRYTSDNYRLVDDYIDWSPAQDLSSEPAADETYVVTYIYEQVDYAIVTLGTTYVEETGVDIVWRSTETKTADGICSPGQDALIPLPAMDTFSGYGAKTVKDYTYIVEDNDLWVDTSVVDVEGIPHILGTLKNRNPKENWFPLITPGFYYLKEEEFYMYSETLETPLEEKEIPIAKNVSYVPTAKDMGIRLEPSRSNLITNSTLENKDWKTAGTFNFKTV